MCVLWQNAELEWLGLKNIVYKKAILSLDNNQTDIWFKFFQKQLNFVDF